MRIVHLAAGAGSMYCGACARDAVLARALGARGHDVTIIPLYTPLKLDSAEGLKIGRMELGGISAFLAQAVPGFGVLHRVAGRLLDAPSFVRWASQFAVSTDPRKLGPMTVSVLEGNSGKQAKLWTELVASLGDRTPRADLVTITNSMLSAAVPAIQKLGIPVACFLQGEETFLDVLPEPWRTRAWDQIRKNLANCEALVATQTDYASEMAARLGLDANRFVVLPPCVEVPAGVPKPPSSRLQLTYISAILPSKGLDLLVEALSELGDHKGISLHVAGKTLDKGFETRVRELAKRKGVGRQIQWLGEVDARTKTNILRNTSVFVLPSRLAERRGIAALEALACGVPCVVPDSGIFSATKGAVSGMVCFGSPTPESVAEAIRKALTLSDQDPNLRTRTVDQTLRLFGADTVAATAEILFQSVAAMKRST